VPCSSERSPIYCLANPSAEGCVPLLLMGVSGIMGHVTRTGRPPMSVDDVLNVCTLMLPAVVMWFLRVHLRENERERQ
jgi:hypothetical protein